MAEATNPNPTSIKAVADYLRIDGETLGAFARQWKQLSDTDKEQLRNGIADGTYNY